MTFLARQILTATALNDALAAAGSGATYDTVAAVQAATVPVLVNAVRTNGYYAAGDGGGALYKRVSSAPSHALKLQSADGAWWEIGEAVVNVLQAGAPADGSGDDLAAFVAIRDRASNGQAVRIRVPFIPGRSYKLSSSFLSNGRLVYVEQDEGVSIAGPGIVYTDAWEENTVPRQNSVRRGAPAGGYQTLGQLWNYTNTSASTVGFGQRYNYTNDGAPSSGFDLAYGIVANWKGMAGAQGQCQWLLYHTPNSGTWTGGFVSHELNPVNRGPDMGWSNKPGSLSRWVGGIRFVPESQVFTGDGGTGRHVLFAFTLARPNADNTDGIRPRTYNGYLIEPDAIAPSGYGAYFNGSTSVTSSEWYTAFGLQDTFKAGIDFTGATFENSHAVKLDAGDKVAWFTSATENAYTLGASGYLALNPGSTGYITATVPDSAAAGGNARGTNAVDMQNKRAAAAQVASGTESVIGGGSNNTASNTNATIAGGTANTASSTNTTVGGGTTNTASANGATVPGGNTNTANGSYSVATGSNSIARSQHGRIVHAAGAFASSGDAQIGTSILRMSTTDATATPISANGSAPSATTVVAMPNNSAYAFAGEVVARNTSTGDTAMWTVVGLIKRGANAAATAFVGSPTVTRVFNDASAAWTVAATADTTNGGLTLTVTGEAAKTIRWVANIRTTEVA